MDTIIWLGIYLPRQLYTYTSLAGNGISMVFSSLSVQKHSTISELHNSLIVESFCTLGVLHTCCSFEPFGWSIHHFLQLSIESFDFFVKYGCGMRYDGHNEGQRLGWSLCLSSGSSPKSSLTKLGKTELDLGKIQSLYRIRSCPRACSDPIQRLVPCHTSFQLQKYLSSSTMIQKEPLSHSPQFLSFSFGFWSFSFHWELYLCTFHTVN